ncbi:MAG: chloride channel protein [Bacteroidales bacterium]|nr:MAG: chloride channel protein [Bacteroidales bacterium]
MVSEIWMKYYLCELMKFNRLLIRIFRWRTKHIGDRQFLIILSVIVGLLTGFGAVIIKNLVHLIQTLLTRGFDREAYNYFYFFFPTAGILLTVLFVKFILRQRVGHGIPSVLYAISKNNGIVKPHNLFSSIITSAMTVGFGGSVGLEGPTVATGAAIGSSLGRLLRLNYRQIILMLGCASAGAMSAIFKAPIAAIVFALEVIMLNLSMSSLVPLLISSATAALTSYFFLGQDVLYSFELKEAFRMEEIPFYIGIGVLTGLVSVYFTRMYMLVTGFFDKINKWHSKLLTGGLILGILVFFVPSLYGEGYQAINNCLNGNFNYLFDYSFYYGLKDSIFAMFIILLVIILFKVIATSVTFGSGGVGGIFAPTLFLGANTGLFFAKVCNQLGFGISESNFALVGMAGLLAGVIHAPLTAIFLIAEVTGGYGLFMPLMITATISYATIRFFESNSVYTIQLARRGELITHDRDKAALSMMKVTKLIEKNFNTIGPDATLGELVNVISKSVRNIFPVVDENKILLGVVWVNDIRHIVFKTELYEKTYVRDLMFMPEPSVSPDESMEEVATKFQNSSHYNLPVLDNGKYVGFVSRANVFSTYRSIIREFSEE